MPKDRRPTGRTRPMGTDEETMNAKHYDSRYDTIEHILRVRELISVMRNKLEARGVAHDRSKLGPNEKPILDRVTPKLKGLTYGSDEYKASLAEMGPALAHHYAHNSHHPEHYQKQVCIICFSEYPNDYKKRCKECGNGQMTNEPNISGMSLLDVLEMLCDWKAATERHADGNIDRSLKVNRERFNISAQLHAILENTVLEMGW